MIVYTLVFSEKTGRFFMYAVLSNTRAITLFSVVAGCCLIMICSLIRVPFYPVPMTMHTFAIFTLGLTQPPRIALASVLFFLAIGTGNPAWIIGKCGGYYLSFPIAAYLIAWSARRASPYLAVLLGQGVIFLMGFFWLLPFFGFRVALMKGVVIFLPSALVKMLFAVQFARKK